MTVVFTEMPLTRTSDVNRNPLPSRATRVVPSPAFTLAGDTELMTGANVAPATDREGAVNV